MMRFVPVIVAVAVTTLFGGPGYAQPNVMDPVVVTASRQEENLNKVPAQVTVISAEEIEELAATSVPEILRSVPGVMVSDISGNGRKYTVDLLGFGETAALNTLVLVDGRRVNQADLSGVDWTLIHKERIERIEIIHGGRGSTLYGDNAAGGVINIITKTGTDSLQARLRGTAGSYSTRNGEITLSDTLGDLSFALNANSRSSDGYRDNSETTGKDFGLNAGYQLTEAFALRLAGGYHEDKAGLPGDLTESDLASGLKRTDSTSPDDFSDIEDWYLQGGARLFLSDTSYLDLDLARRERTTDFFSFFDVGEYRGHTEIETDSVSPKLVINERLLNFDSRLVFGYDYEKSREAINNNSVFFGLPSTAEYDLSKNSSGYYSNAEVDLLDKLSFSLGYRHQKAKFNFEAITADSSATQQLKQDLYSSGLNYILSNSLSAYVSYAKSYRNPVLDEMFNFVSNSINPDLKQQTADNYTAGLRFQPNPGFKLGLNLFYSVSEQEIFYNPFSFANENLDADGIRQGGTLTLTGQLYDAWLSASYTYRATKIDGGQYDGSELPNVPRHQGTVGLQTPLGENFDLNLRGSYIGERHFISDFANQNDKLEDYFLLSGKLSYLIDAGSIYLSVNNILDEEYSEYGVISWSGERAWYPSPGISALLGFDMTF